MFSTSRYLPQITQPGPRLATPVDRQSGMTGSAPSSWKKTPLNAPASGTPSCVKFSQPTDPAVQTTRLKNVPKAAQTTAETDISTETFNHTIREATRSAYNLLRETQNSFKKADKDWTTGPVQLTQSQKNKAALKKNFTEWRDHPKPGPAIKDAGTKAYQALCKNREPSALEKHLPADSAFRSKLYPPNGAFRDPKTGFCCALKQDPDNPRHFILCIPGTGRGNAWGAQLKLDGEQFLGMNEGLPPAYQQGLALFNELKEALAQPPTSASLSVAGHSLGGGIASSIGCRHPDVKAVCFNAAALGKTLQNHLTATLQGKEPDNVAHIQIAGDPVSSPGAQKKLRSLAAFLTGGKESKITMPVHFGKRYRAPLDMVEAANRNPLSRHRLKALGDLYQTPGSSKPSAPA